MATEFPDGTSVLVRRTLPAPVSRVWRAFTEPLEMAAFMWAGLGSEATALADLRVGGRYEVYMTPPQPDPNWSGERWGFFGYYTEVAEPGRLAYTLHWDAPVGYNQGAGTVADEVVILDFEAAERDTIVKMWHLGIPAIDGAAPEHGRGIEAEFDVLERLLLSDP